MSKTTTCNGIPTIEQGGVDASDEWAPVPADQSGRSSAAPQGHPDFRAPLSRRDFLIAATGTVATAALTPLMGCEWPASQPAPGPPPPTPVPTPAPILSQEPLRAWEDAYRYKWTWDKTYSGTHNINCGWQVACDWKIYVKDGVVFREEQHARYPQAHPGVPAVSARISSANSPG